MSLAFFFVGHKGRVIHKKEGTEFPIFRFRCVEASESKGPSGEGPFLVAGLSCPAVFYVVATSYR
jgi:hypothetical protein